MEGISSTESPHRKTLPNTTGINTLKMTVLEIKTNRRVIELGPKIMCYSYVHMQFVLIVFEEPLSSLAKP